MNAKLKQTIAEWQELTAWLKDAKEKEMTLRKAICKQLFPEPKEGSNKYVSAGIEAEMKHRVDRNVDEALLKQLTPELRKYGIAVDALVNWKPELALRVYRDLDARKRKFFERVLVIKDGSPSLTINSAPTNE